MVHLAIEIVESKGYIRRLNVNSETSVKITRYYKMLIYNHSILSNTQILFENLSSPDEPLSSLDQPMDCYF